MAFNPCDMSMHSASQHTDATSMTPRTDESAESMEPYDIPAAFGRWADSSMAGLREFRKRAQRALASEPPRTTVAVARQLQRLAAPGSLLVACELLDVSRIRAVLTPADVTAMGTQLDSWVSVDTFAVYVLGPSWREGRVSDDYLREWADNADRWRRRAALAATVALNTKARGGNGDAPRTLAICRLLVSDRDDMVVKALSWSLRELAKRDAAPVERFLREYGEQLAPRVRREVTRKLTTGTKSGHGARPNVRAASDGAD